MLSHLVIINGPTSPNNVKYFSGQESLIIALLCVLYWTKDKGGQVQLIKQPEGGSQSIFIKSFPV